MTSTQNADQTAPEPASSGNSAAIARPWLLLIAALAVGFICEALLHGQPFGVGYAVAAVVAVVVWIVTGFALGLGPSRSALALLVLILFFSAMVAVRASYPLLFLNILTGWGLALLTAAVYLQGGLHRMSLTEHVIALATGVFALVVQPFLFVFGDLPASGRASGRTGRALPLLLGLLLATPLLLIFGALFVSADAVFAEYVRRTFAWLTDFPQLMARLFASLALAWIALGLARRAFTARRQPVSSDVAVPLGSLTLGPTPVIVVLALVDLLFLAFVIVQAVYLFGGDDTLLRTGMSYSEYARRGFFELVAVAALVLALVLAFDWLSRGSERRSRFAISLLHGLLILLTFVILASALIRMRLYQAEFGLTELRFYTTAFMAWVAAVLVLAAVTVVPARVPFGSGRRTFAFGALVALLALVAFLDLANPDAWIARVNLERAISGAGEPLDAAYLTNGLSLDAVPAIVAGLENLPDSELRTELACGLQWQAQAVETQAGYLTWRGSNLGIASARRALAANRPSWRGLSCP